jgi:iron(III) transport system permease protein
LSATVAFIATIVGTACGFLFNKIKSYGFNTYRKILAMPLLISPYIFAVAWKDAFSVLFGQHASLYSISGVVIVHVLIFFPIAMLITGSALSSVHTTIEEAGLVITSFKSMVIRILFPLIKHSIALSFLLVLLFSLTDFSVPAFFGVRTFTTEIFTQFAAFYNYQQAIAQSILLLLVSCSLILLEYKYLAKSPVFAIGEKGSATKYYELSKGKEWIYSTIVFLILVAIVLPVFILIHQSLSGSKFYFLEAFDLLKGTIGRSFLLAFCGSLVITSIALHTSYTEQRKGMRFSGAVLLFLFVTPSTVLGIAYIYFYNTPATTFIYASSAIIILGYVGRFGFIAHKIVSNGLKQVPPSMEEAAALIGIGAYRRYIKLVIPLLTPSLITAFLLVFILCLSELGTTIMVYPPGTELMPLKVYTISANAPLALTSSMTLINLTIIALVILMLYTFSKRIPRRYEYK